MTCPTCGQAAQGSERFCSHCGSDLTQAAPAAPSAAPADGPRGVGGWLLLFCVWLTIVDPLLELRLLRYLQYATWNWLLLASLGVTVVGVVTGIQLWRVRPQALTCLRLYFAVAVSLVVAGIIFLLPTLRVIGLFGMAGVAHGWLRALAFLGVWFAYFKLSRRVRNTYGRNL